MTKPFTNVELRQTYPTQDVAEHEVLMAFNGDDDAVNFHVWWHEEGAMVFAAWLEGAESREQAQQMCDEIFGKKESAK